MINPFFHALLSINEEAKEITSIGETLSYTWFGRPNYAYKNYRYWVGTTRDTPLGTTQHITQYDEDSDEFVTTQVGTVYQKDDHNQVQILIRASDNKLIAFFVEHNGSDLRWRISDNPLDSTSWGIVKSTDPLGNYSYVSPYQSSAGYIYIFFRVVSGSSYIWYYCKSTDDGNTFGSPTQFLNNGATQSYVISSQNGNEIHFAATNGHPQSNSSLNINVYHFYFDMLSETWHKSDGAVLTLPTSSATQTQVISFTGNDSSWILDIVLKEGKPRILYAFYPSGRSTSFYEKELWFIEWNGVAWINNIKIANTMSGYIEDDLSIQELCYTGASRFSIENPDVIWMPKQVGGILEIHKVDISNMETIFIEQLTFDSTVNNWRPISVMSSKYNLLWLRNNDYNTFTDYDITLMAKTIIV